ncbi:MAG: VWA domain-containing protein, partial [bacterium]|nr:VWA domain-containing protein [bacterium]
MILAFGFLTPWLLLGGAAVAIPFVLHLLSNVRVKEMDFPTLRFLQMSMEKTAHRRRVQHWLLLLIRAGLLGLLAIAVAEPITQAFGGWMGRGKQAVVVVLDNSYSMGTAVGNATRLSQAKAQAQALLTGDNPPTSGAVLKTNGASANTEMTSDWSALGRSAGETPLSAGRAGVLQKIRQAAKLLDEHDSVSQKSIYVFTDLQRASFEEIASAESLIAKKNIHVMIVNTSAPENRNVGISNIELSGRRIVNSVMEATATIANSSPGDHEAWVGMRIDGKLAGQPRKITLAGAGKDGSVAT